LVSRKDIQPVIKKKMLPRKKNPGPPGPECFTDKFYQYFKNSHHTYKIFQKIKKNTFSVILHYPDSKSKWRQHYRENYKYQQSIYNNPQ
jgi:hypothetical protein